MIRCINIDWLQVSLVETKPMDANYFRSIGYKVVVRDYGTPLFAQMFTICEGDRPVFEIRREPYSLKKNGGIFADGAVHLRLHNRMCYQPNPVDQLRKFIITHGYTYVGIVRIDICLDITKFDYNQDPDKFVQDYMRRRFQRDRNGNVSAHGTERDDRHWQSIKWGSDKSMLNVKMYDKTLELAQGQEKTYIRQHWHSCGLSQSQKVRFTYQNSGVQKVGYKLVEVVPGTAVPEHVPMEDTQPIKVWRIEFSISSQCSAYIDEDGVYIANRLDAYDTPDKLWNVFSILAHNLFSFRHVERTRTGSYRRKALCAPYPLLRLDATFAKPMHLNEKQDPTRTDRILIKKLIEWAHNENTPYKLRLAIERVATEMIEQKNLQAFSYKLQQLIDFNSLNRKNC